MMPLGKLDCSAISATFVSVKTKAFVGEKNELTSTAGVPIGTSLVASFTAQKSTLPKNGAVLLALGIDKDEPAITQLLLVNAKPYR